MKASDIKTPLKPSDLPGSKYIYNCEDQFFAEMRCEVPLQTVCDIINARAALNEGRKS
jgi:hypothetical protein